MISFSKIYEAIFKSFKVDWDANVIKELEWNWINHLMIIKRSWIFWILLCRRLFVISIIAGINCYLLYLNFWDNTTTYVIISLLALNILYWIFSIIIYLTRFKKIFWNTNEIIEIWTLKEKLSKWARAFERFFNQTILNYFILIWIWIFILYTFIFWLVTTESGFWWLLNIILFWVQIYLSWKLKKRFTDLQMDFNVIIPWRILFYNQSWVLQNSQSIDSEKIKMIFSEYPNFISSFFDLGNIAISTEWDEADQRNFQMFYVKSPNKTVEEINKLINEWFVWSTYLEKILKKLKINQDEYKEERNLEKIKNFLDKNEIQVKKDYESWNEKVKKEIEEIYSLLK